MALHSVDKPQSLFGSSKFILIILVVLLFIAGQLVRMKDLTDPPVDILPQNQVQFLLNAQGQAARDPSLPVLDYSSNDQNAPLLQGVDSLISNLTGVSLLTTSRMISILGWLVAAALLFYLLWLVSGADAAVIGLAMFLFIPFTIQISRSVLPAAWATALMIAGLLCLFFWKRDSSWISAAGFALLAAVGSVLDAAVLYLSLCLLAGMVIVLRRGISRRQVLQAVMMVVVIIAVRLAAVIIHDPNGSFPFAVLGISGPLSSLLSIRKLSRIELRIESIIGILGIVFSLFGVLLTEKGAKRSALISLWIGFLVYCFIQVDAISQSFYPLYLLMLLVVLSFVPLIERVIARLLAERGKWLILIGVCVIMAGGAALGSLGGRKLASTSEQKTLPETWQSAGLSLGDDAVFLSNSEEYTLMTAYYGGATPLCLPGDAVCRQSLEEIADQYPELPLYYLTSTGSLDEDQSLQNLIAGFTLRCNIGGGLTIIPLTDEHPACTEAMQ